MIRTLDQIDDLDPPAPDDIMVGPRNAWRVLDVEPVDSPVWPYRFRCRVEPLGPHHGVTPFPTGEGRVITTTTYRRGEGPLDHFGPPIDRSEASP